MTLAMPTPTPKIAPSPLAGPGMAHPDAVQDVTHDVLHSAEKKTLDGQLKQAQTDRGGDMAESSSSSSGIGFSGLLTVLFIGLKLTGHIAWSWWWVLSPIWIGLALFLVLILVAALFYHLSGRSKPMHRW